MEARRENGDGSGGESSGPPPPSSPPPSAVVHPAVAPWSYLLGRWRGEGEGGYPTINSFKYGEEILFSHSGKPVIAYTQKTWKLASGEPMHAQSGYWQPKPDGSIEVTIAQSTGLTEVQNCSYDAQNRTVTHQSELVGNASKVQSFQCGRWQAFLCSSNGNTPEQSYSHISKPCSERFKMFYIEHRLSRL